MTLLRIALAVYFLQLAAAVHIYADEPTVFQKLGSETIDENDVLAFGGSFGPITLEHGGLAARLMHRLVCGRASLFFPFLKSPGAAPATTSLHLTRVAVDHFSEVLKLNSIGYKNFKGADGKATFEGRGGRQFE